MRRTVTIIGAAVLALVVVLVALLLTRGAEQAAAPGTESGPGSTEPDFSACLGDRLAELPECEPLRERLEAQEDRVVDIVIVVEDATATADADRAIGLITDATAMWQGGLDGLTGDDGEARELSLTTERVSTGGAHPLLDPEIIFVIAADDEEGSGTTLEVYDRDGARCAAYADAFAFDAWRDRDGFDSHHRLPEGTLDQDCGGDDATCVAVNATFVAGGVDPMEAFRLVGDELGHCLRRQ